MRTLFSLIVIGFFFFVGCSTGYNITYNSNPIGASVVCNGTNYGYAPLKLNYSPSQENITQGTMRTSACTAIWVSGARKDYGTEWDLEKFPDGVMQTAQRPNIGGYSQDAEFALKVQQMKIQQRQADAQAQQNFNNSLQNFNNSMQNIRNNTPKTTTCRYYEWSKTTICN